MKKFGGISSTFKDAIVPVPSAHSGEGSFGNTVPAQGPTASPIKPVQFGNVEGGKAGGKGFGPNTGEKTTLKG